MGTHSLTRVIDGRTHILNMYRQLDGYPSGHGKELAEFLAGKSIVNGFGHDTGQAFNGAGCMAASIVAHFKTGIGNIYLAPTSAKDCGQDYEYVLMVKKGELTVKVLEYSVSVFSGTVEEFLTWCQVTEG